VVGLDRKEDIFNAAAVFQGGKIAAVYHKMFLPNYGVFDEFRYFRAGRACPVFRIGDAMVGISICEGHLVPGRTVPSSGGFGAEVLINISASPYHFGKATVARTHAEDESDR
jgi:NAD+ synthase (glutamine-hydrolysing)